MIRDRETDKRLKAAGRQVLRIPEHEPVEEAASRVEAAVRSQRLIKLRAASR